MSGQTHTCSETNEYGCLSSNPDQKKWFVACECGGNRECSICQGTQKQYLDRCPVHYMDTDMITFRYLYNCFNDKNILPYNGSSLDQPKVIMDQFDLLDRYLQIHVNIDSVEKEMLQESVDFIKGKG